MTNVRSTYLCCGGCELHVPGCPYEGQINAQRGVQNQQTLSIEEQLRALSHNQLAAQALCHHCHDMGAHQVRIPYTLNNIGYLITISRVRLRAKGSLPKTPRGKQVQQVQPVQQTQQ